MTAQTALYLALALHAPVAPAPTPPVPVPAPKLVAPVVVQPVVPAPTYVDKLVVTHRAPTGQHTHTCPNGHTWDHLANPTHNCQFCGLAQYMQDIHPRPVTVIQRIRVAVPPP